MDAVGGPMLKQVKQLGMNVKFMGGDGICTGELPKLAGDAIGEDMVVCAEAGGVDGDFKKAAGRASRPSSRPRTASTCRSMHRTSTTRSTCWPRRWSRPVRPTRKSTCRKSAKTDGYKGVTGPIAFDEKGDIKNGALTLYTYKGGKREQIAVVR